MDTHVSNKDFTLCIFLICLCEWMLDPNKDVFDAMGTLDKEVGYFCYVSSRLNMVSDSDTVVQRVFCRRSDLNKYRLTEVVSISNPSSMRRYPILVSTPVERTGQSTLRWTVYPPVCAFLIPSRLRWIALRSSLLLPVRDTSLC